MHRLNSASAARKVTCDTPSMKPINQWSTIVVREYAGPANLPVNKLT